jgi:glycosyltransferase involved in cell wall biosynthesis
VPLHTPTLSYILQDLNPWGGQERVTLEVARRLSHHVPVEVFSYTFHDAPGSGPWGARTFHPIRPLLRKPEGIKALLFYALATPRIRAAKRRGSLLHAAGACAITSDVVQMHFVHAAWRAVLGRLPEEMRRPPGAAPGRPLRNALLSAYHARLTGTYIAMERAAYRPHKTYIACSRRVAGELEEHFGLRERVHVIHHGIDPDEYRPAQSMPGGPEDRAALRASLGIAPDEVVALFVGGFDRKGLPTVLRAMHRLSAAALGRSRLVAIGQGNRARFLDLARQHGCGDRVTLLDPQRGIARYYRAADLMVFPTLYEPFGMVIAEALASGLPTIVSGIAGASELIPGPEAGVLLGDPSDPDEVAAAWDRLVIDDEGRRRMGVRAREAVAWRTWDVVAREHLAVLSPLLRERAG